jgi:hypothetical protein
MLVSYLYSIGLAQGCKDINKGPTRELLRVECGWCARRVEIQRLMRSVSTDHMRLGERSTSACSTTAAKSGRGGCRPDFSQ